MSTMSQSDIEAIARSVAGLLSGGAGAGSSFRAVAGAEVEDAEVVDGVGTVKSWADEVSDESEGVAVSFGPVTMPGGGGVSDGVKVLKFGGMADVVGTSSGHVPKGFYALYVRTPNVLDYQSWLLRECSVRLPKKALEELALVSYTTATVPGAFGDGPARIRTLAAVGDAVLSFVLVARMHASGQAVASCQAARASKLTNSTMSRLFVESGLFRFVAFPAGVDAASTKAGADALEALFGVLAGWRDMSAVVKVANRIGLF